MTDTTRSLVEQHIREYDMRLKHLDDLLGEAQRKVTQSTEPESSAQLAKLKLERDKLAGWVDEIKRKPIESLHEDETMKAGPMGIWDEVALQVEKLVERMEK